MMVKWFMVGVCSCIFMGAENTYSVSAPFQLEEPGMPARAPLQASLSATQPTRASTSRHAEAPGLDSLTAAKRRVSVVYPVSTSFLARELSAPPLLFAPHGIPLALAGIESRPTGPTTTAHHPIFFVPNLFVGAPQAALDAPPPAPLGPSDFAFPTPTAEVPGHPLRGQQSGQQNFEVSQKDLCALVNNYKVPKKVKIDQQYTNCFKRKVIKQIKAGELTAPQMVKKALKEKQAEYADLYHATNKKKGRLPDNYPWATLEQTPLINYVKNDFVPKEIKDRRIILSMRKEAIRQIKRGRAATLEKVQSELERLEQGHLRNPKNP